MAFIFSVRPIFDLLLYSSISFYFLPLKIDELTNFSLLASTEFANLTLSTNSLRESIVFCISLPMARSICFSMVVSLKTGTSVLTTTWGSSSFGVYVPVCSVIVTAMFFAKLTSLLFCSLIATSITSSVFIFYISGFTVSVWTAVVANSFMYYSMSSMSDFMPSPAHTRSCRLKSFFA